MILALRGRGGDLEIYLRASARFLDGSAVYRAEDGVMPFKYSPPAAWFFVPLAVLPVRTAAAVWNAGIIASLAVTAQWFVQWPGHAFDARQFPKIMATAASLQFIFFELFYGQVDALMLVALAGSAVFAEKSRPVLSGLFFSVAVIFKPTALVFGLYFLLRRHAGALLSGGMWSVILWLPVLIRFGFSGTGVLTTSWVEILTTGTRPWMLAANIQGLPTLVLAFLSTGQNTLSEAGWAQAMSVVLFVVPLVWVRPEPRDLAALLCLGVALLSPQAWRACFVLAWPLLYVAIAPSPGETSRSAVVLSVILLGFGLVVRQDVLGIDLETAVLKHRPLTLIMVFLFGLASWRALRAR